MGGRWNAIGRIGAWSVLVCCGLLVAEAHATKQRLIGGSGPVWLSAQALDFARLALLAALVPALVALGIGARSVSRALSLGAQAHAGAARKDRAVVIASMAIVAVAIAVWMTPALASIR